MKRILFSYRKMFIAATIVIAQFLTVPINECFSQQPDNKSTNADTGNFTINGILLNKDGTPIKGKEVYIFHVQDGRAYAALKSGGGYADPSGKSDAAGKFTIKFGSKFIEALLSKKYTVGIHDDKNDKPASMQKDDMMVEFGLDVFDKKAKIFDVGKLILDNDKLMKAVVEQSQPRSKVFEIRGTFVDAGGKPLKDLMVLLMAVTDEKPGYTFPNKKGQFDATSKSDGSLSLSVNEKDLGDWKEFTLLVSPPGSLGLSRIWVGDKALVFTIDRNTSNTTLDLGRLTVIIK